MGVGSWISKEIKEQIPFARFEFYKWAAFVLAAGVITFFSKWYAAVRGVPDRYFYGVLFIVAFVLFVLVGKLASANSRERKKEPAKVKQQLGATADAEPSADDELRRVANEDAARMNERLVVMESIADCHFDVPNRYIDLRFRLTNMSVFRVLSPSIEGYLTYRNQPLPNAPQIIGPSFEVGHAETGVLTVRHFVSGEFADEIRAAVGKVSIDFGHAPITFSFSHESNTFKWSTGEVVIAIRDRGETANELWEQEIAGGEAGTDLRFEALQVTNGIDVNFDETFIFIYARIVSKKPTSILSITPKIYANGELHDCEHLTNLSGWVWIKESASSKYPFTTTTRDNLEDHSLWRILQKEPLISEVHRAGWIGIKTVKLRTAEPLEAISSMFVTVEDGGSLKHKFNFQPPWPPVEGKIAGAHFFKQQ